MNIVYYAFFRIVEIKWNLNHYITDSKMCLLYFLAVKCYLSSYVSLFFESLEFPFFLISSSTHTIKKTKVHSCGIWLKCLHTSEQSYPYTPHCLGHLVIVRSLPTIHMYLPAIFGTNALIWGFFQNVWKGRFWGHWGQRTFKVEFWGCNLEFYS